MSQSDRELFINWAKHLDSDGYFGALEAYDEFIAPLIESLEQITHMNGVKVYHKSTPWRPDIFANQALTAIRRKLGGEG